MDELDEGMIFDMLTEQGNDAEGEYHEVATQVDFDKF